MRGRIDEQPPLFHVFSVEDRIRPDHPLREVKRRVDALLAALDAQFTAAYSRTGRPSVPPERLLKALLLMTLYSIRSERQLQARLGTDGYALSQRCRKKIEEGIGWVKTVAGLARSRWVGRWKLRQMAELAAAAYNLVRMRKLLPAG